MARTSCLGKRGRQTGDPTCSWEGYARVLEVAVRGEGVWGLYERLKRMATFDKVAGRWRITMSMGGRFVTVKLAAAVGMLLLRGPLPPGTEIHHRDLDRANDEPGNLDLAGDFGEHIAMEGRGSGVTLQGGKLGLPGRWVFTVGPYRYRTVLRVLCERAFGQRLSRSWTAKSLQSGVGGLRIDRVVMLRGQAEVREYGRRWRSGGEEAAREYLEEISGRWPERRGDVFGRRSVVGSGVEDAGVVAGGWDDGSGAGGSV